MPLVSSCLVARRRAVHDGDKRGPACASQVVCSAMTARLLRTTISYTTHESVVLVSLSSWHKRRGLSPPMCAMLTPSHATLACATWQKGFVSPMCVGLSARVVFHDEWTRVMRRDA